MAEDGLTRQQHGETELKFMDAKSRFFSSGFCMEAGKYPYEYDCQKINVTFEPKEDDGPIYMDVQQFEVLSFYREDEWSSFK